MSSRRGMLGWVVVLAACGALTSPPEPPPAQKVLFIGNSLTYVNQLPELMAALAESAGAGRIAVHAVAFPDFSLEDHWNDGSAARAIDGGDFDVVVLQQGPSALEESRVLLIDYATRFAAIIRGAGGEPALYMVWPSRARFGDFQRVSDSYRIAADSVDGLFLPCGDAWRAAWTRDSLLALYGPDGFHPSALGTYAAALVMVQRLTGKSPIGLPTRVTLRSGGTFTIAPSVGALLQEAAAEALGAPSDP